MKAGFRSIVIKVQKLLNFPPFHTIKTHPDHVLCSFSSSSPARKWWILAPTFYYFCPPAPIIIAHLVARLRPHPFLLLSSFSWCFCVLLNFTQSLAYLKETWFSFRSLIGPLRIWTWARIWLIICTFWRLFYCCGGDFLGFYWNKR